MAVSVISLHSMRQNILTDSRDTKADPTGPQPSICPSMDPIEPLKLTLNCLRNCHHLSGCFYYFHIVHSPAPLNVLGHFIGHCDTIGSLRGPSWTSLDLQIDPRMDPVRLILGDPCQKNGPRVMVHIDKIRI